MARPVVPGGEMLVQDEQPIGLAVVHRDHVAVLVVYLPGPFVPPAVVLPGSESSTTGPSIERFINGEPSEPLQRALVGGRLFARRLSSFFVVLGQIDLPAAILFGVAFVVATLASRAGGTRRLFLDSGRAAPRARRAPHHGQGEAGGKVHDEVMTRSVDGVLVRERASPSRATGAREALSGRQANVSEPTPVSFAIDEQGRVPTPELSGTESIGCSRLRACSKRIRFAHGRRCRFLEEGPGGSGSAPHGTALVRFVSAVVSRHSGRPMGVCAAPCIGQPNVPLGTGRRPPSRHLVP